MNASEQRGLEIAANARITKRGNETWIVPSQSLNGRYAVTITEEGSYCTCPQFELTQRPCKHVYAVQFSLFPETRPHDVPEMPPTPASVRPTYTQNWPAYNAAQTEEKETFCRLLRDLCDGIPEETQQRGRPRLPLRAVESDFAVDSTGFGLQRFYRHYTAKYGHEQYVRDYVKLHAMIGVKTHIVTAATVTDRDRHDITQFKPLLEKTAENFAMAEVSADKAYSSREMVAFIDNMGVFPLIPFRRNSTIKPNRKAPAWDRLFHFYNFKRDEFLAHYHKRSNVESAFSSMKRKFGDFIRSTTEVAQINEVLLKMLAHNIVCLVHSIHELGIAPMLTDALPTKSLSCPENKVQI